MKQIVITGASGYIGRNLIVGAKTRGWHVIAATRRRIAVNDVDWISYTLEDEIRADDYPLAAVLVHLAANTSAGSGADEELEVKAAQRLLTVARERGLRVIFLSSQTARPDAPTMYGRAKWRIEREVLDSGGAVVRAGLVYGGAPGGVFGQLCQLVQRAPLLPALIPSPRVQPIHVGELVEGILRIAERDDLPQRIFSLAAEDPVSFTCVLRAIAASRVRRCRVFIPVPVAAVKAAMSLANRFFGCAFDIGRVDSLIELPQLATAQDLKILTLRLRSYSSGMHAPGCDRRRRLLAEGSTLLSYVLSQPPSRGQVKRYARVVEMLRNGEPVRLPRHAFRFPWSLVLLDSRDLLADAGAHELDWRLDAATVLAEASCTGAGRFLLIGRPVGAGNLLLRVVRVVAAEVFWRSARWLLSPLLRRALATRHAVQQQA